MSQLKNIYEKEVVPYWDGGALRDKMFNQLSDEWHTIYNCGLITETMEQRAPGSMALDGRMFGMGLKKAKQEIEAAIEKLDFLNDFNATDKREQLIAMAISCDGMMLYANRYADLLEENAPAPCLNSPGMPLKYNSLRSSISEFSA